MARPTARCLRDPADPVNRDVVVAAAIVHQGRLLAARRSYPAAAAGRWELPGGKVDSGEPADHACVREVHEELHCRVRVVRRLPGEQPLGEGLMLHGFECALIDGEPVPSEHDAIRWLAPEELDDVAWLDADRPFLAGLRERLLDGERLPGGNVGGAVRIGATVRRVTGPWTPAVHALLAYLDEAGVDRIPRVLGSDERGREVLTHLPGKAADPDEGLASLPLLHDAMRWLRRYHDVVADFRPDSALPWRSAPLAPAPGEVICHNDFAPYNWTTVDGHLVGVIDWDVAGPGPPIDDVAFAAWNAVPLYRDVGTAQSARRLKLMCEAYGELVPRAVLSTVDRRIGLATERIRAGAAAGDLGMRNLVATGVLDRVAAQSASFRTRLPALAAALGRS